VQVSNNVRFSSRQFVLAWAVLAAWQILGGDGRALADYMSITCLSRGNDLPAASLLGSRSWENEGNGKAIASDSRRGDRSTEAWYGKGTRDSISFAKLHSIAWQMGGSDDGVGSSSGPVSVNNPTNQYAGGVSYFDLLGTEVVGLLLPPSSRTRPFSLTSFLFRPPRAS
jgi:hypothetical protein